MSILDPNDPLGHLSAEQIQALFDKAVENEATDNSLRQEEEAAKDFIMAHPEYIANKRNGALLETAIQYSGTVVRSFEDIEKVYDDMRDRGLLELDAQVLQQQEQEARRNRIAQARTFNSIHRAEETEAEREQRAYTMPLEDLETLANWEMQEARNPGGGGIAMEYSESRPPQFSRRRRSGI